MKKLSLKQKILNRLQEMKGQWVHKGRIEERVKEWGYLADTGDRECRKLAEDGLIDRKEENGSVSYRFSDNKTLPVKPKIAIIIKNGMPMALLQ